VEDAKDLAVQVASEDPEEGLRAVAALRRLLERIERIHVANARERGASWQDIADELGVSKQAVHKKYAGKSRRW
jgi:predicted transcriptional regulator